MATVEVNKKDLEKLIGKRLDAAKLNEDLYNVKLELDREEDESMFIELEYDRADMLSTEGIARQLRGYYGVETGLKHYEAKPSKSSVVIDKEMKKYRPYAEYFIALNVPFNDDSIKQIMQIQEKLHFVYAKDRELASIGVYDYDKTSKNFTYKPMKPEQISFVPLETSKKMNGREILKNHPKGIDFAHLLDNLDKYPILADDSGKVLSMPPIINSEDTKVDEKTKNIFVDVTGIDANVVKKITVILATMLAERGAKIESVYVEFGSEKYTTPDLNPSERKVSPDYIRRNLGMNLENAEMTRLLKKQRMDASLDHGEILVKIPCYRTDITHDIDLVEEIACAYGLNNMKPVLPNVATIGEIHKIEKKSQKARRIMAGLGFQEVLTFILSNRKTFEDCNEEPVDLKNFQSEEYNCVRNSLTPKLMEFLQKNKHYEMPQRVFECGEVLVVTNKGEEKTEAPKHLAAAITSNEAGFTEIKSICEALLRNLKVNAEYKPLTDAKFIKGRAAEIIDREKNRKIGVIGEISPEVLSKFQLENPVAVFEINVEKLF